MLITKSASQKFFELSANFPPYVYTQAYIGQAANNIY